MGSDDTRGSIASSAAQRPEVLVRHIAALEERVRKLEQALQIRSNGNIILKSAGALRMEANAGIELTSNAGIKLFDFYGNEIEFSPTGVEITSSSKLEMNAANIEQNAGMITGNAGMSRFSGVVQCDTLIATNVVGASYTPGAGNVY